MYNVPWSSTPKWLLLSCRFANTVILLSMLSIISAHLLRISKLNPFNHMVYGPLSNCLRLKTQVTLCPPRLATSEWLVLSRRESHPLYITTLLGRSDRHANHLPSSPPKLLDILLSLFYAFLSLHRLTVHA